MITSFPHSMKVTSGVSSKQLSNGLNRIFAAAVVNRQFCQLLLHEPDTALKAGYLGESFSLTSYERDLIISTHAETLTDFARQINNALKEQYISSTC